MDNVETETEFSVPPGTPITVTCKQNYDLRGDESIMCESGTTFTFTEKPVCKRSNNKSFAFTNKFKNMTISE